jgi:Uncharacterized protein conserved in bacteria (DUF2171)
MLAGGTRTVRPEPVSGYAAPMDEGLPIAYEVLEDGVPVYASDGDSIGTVDHVISAEREDIFHGIVIRVGTDRRFVAADQIASLHERGVDLRIDAAAAAELPHPDGAPGEWRVNEPGVKPSSWKQLLDRVTGRPMKGNWTKED